MKHSILVVASINLLTALSSPAIPVTVEEVSVSPAQTVTITSSTLGTVSGSAGVNNLLVNGIPTLGFCIDPFHMSLPGPQSYNTEPLSDGPKAPGGPMGVAAATEIGQLWLHYFSPGMGAADAAGLQIAIWEIAGGSGFSLQQPEDYGASTMLSWWAQNQNTAPAADLTALTGSGQDYVISNAKPPQSLPDQGTTALLLGGVLGSLLMIRARLGEVAVPQSRALTR